MTDWLLGVDAGLTRVKAALFAPDGEEAAVEARDTPEDRPAPGHHETPLEALWETVAETISTVLEAGPATPETVAAVGVAGHGHGLYLLDADGAPVRPGIRSTDSRAAGLVEAWRADGRAAAVGDRLDYEPFAADPLSLLGWLARHEPDAYAAVDHVLFCKDYLKYRLTGTVCTDEMEASVFGDPPGGGDARAAFEAVGLGSRVDALPEVVPSGEPCGRVDESAADRTGLATGTPVASGLHDVGATALGAGVHAPGQGLLVVGTWGQSLAVLEEPGTGEGAAGLTRRFLDDGWLRYKGNRSATVTLDWFVEAFGDAWRRRAEAAGTSPYEVYDRVVAGVPPGANGLVVHPYVQGSTDDPRATGGVFGLTTEHTAADVLRAIYEGVAISQVERLAEVEPAGGLTDVRLGGGGSRSEVWSGLFADVLGEEVAVPAGEEVGARGAAICAALAAGVHPDHETAVDRMVSVARRHRPDPEAVERYRDHRALFEATLAAVRPTWKRLSAARETGADDG